VSRGADLALAAREVATTAASTLGCAIGAPGQAAEAPAGPVRVRAAHLVVFVPTTGDLAGVTWVLPLAVATALARRMAPGFPADGALIAASACELANILTGRASATLELYGVCVELSAPRLVTAVAAGPAACVACALGTLTVALHAEAANDE